MKVNTQGDRTDSFLYNDITMLFANVCFWSIVSGNPESLNYVWMRCFQTRKCFAGISLILFSPLTNLSILMLNFTELMAADDYFNWILPKCALVSVR